MSLPETVFCWDPAVVPNLGPFLALNVFWGPLHCATLVPLGESEFPHVPRVCINHQYNMMYHLLATSLEFV